MSDPKWSRSISLPANRDIHDVLLYTREDWGLDQVDACEVELIKGLEWIRSFPLVGSQVTSLGHGVRKWRVWHHVISYVVDTEHRHVTVLRVLGERQRVTGDLLTEETE